MAGVLFGSQFIPSKYCPGFSSGGYNISMALGILAGSIISVMGLGAAGIAPAMAAIAFLGGMTWVVGNYLFIIAVARAGMARSFIVINFSAVLSFIGGVVFLGELPGLTAPRLAMMAGAVGLVLLGSFLVTTTAPSNGSKVPGSTGSGTDGSLMRKGLIAAFVATVFFTIYNTMIAYVLNTAGTPVGITFATIAPGAVTGAVLVVILARRNELKDWLSAPVKWHLLAIVQGLMWATAMVFILIGWMGTGIALGTPVQVGTQTLVSSLWGILAFGELRGLKDPGAAHIKFAAGAALTVAGIVLMTLS